jgi:hypothetical protein
MYLSSPAIYLVLVLHTSGRPTQFLCEPYRFPPANRHPNFGCPEEDCICGCHLRSAVTSTNPGHFMHFRDWVIKLAQTVMLTALSRLQAGYG